MNTTLPQMEKSRFKEVQRVVLDIQEASVVSQLSQVDSRLYKASVDVSEGVNFTKGVLTSVDGIESAHSAVEEKIIIF